MVKPDQVCWLLTVDDDMIVQRLYRTFLDQNAPGAFEIVQATSGETALAALRERKFDCILLDFDMPDMTGIEFMRRAADPDGEQPCAVICMTGTGNESIAVEAMKRGAQNYLLNDQMDADSLWRTITQAVTQTELRQRLASSTLDLRRANAALEQEVDIRKATESELRTAKENAEQASLAKTRFVAMVTHELRTPLSGVLGYAQILRMEGELSARQLARVDAMLLAGQHLRNTIENVLDFVSIEADREELHPASVTVRELIETCVAVIRPLAEVRALGVRVVNSIDAPHHIVADPGRMRQIIVNLLGNAVKFTPSGGIELRALAGEVAGGLRIEVADTGPGINEARRERLFQDFERVGAPVSVEGTGLGLAIVARIVRLMGGTIGYAANPPGGSVFWMELPPGDFDLTSQPTRAFSVLAAPEGGKRVLLVDDDEMNLDVIGAFLRAAGHIVTLARNGHEVILYASGTIFDLVLMDVCMPQLDGLEATRRIRALPAPYGQVPILALTARSFIEQQEECRIAGMNGHVSKPVDYVTLVQAVADTALNSVVYSEDENFNPVVSVIKDRSLSRMDRDTLDETLAYVPANQVTGHFLSLRGRMQLLLQLLDEMGTPFLLGETAHTIVANAGMFGFQALSFVARQYERALESNSPVPVNLIQQVRTETNEALTILRNLMHETGMQMA
jgi:signal transduction histidine kinase